MKKTKFEGSFVISWGRYGGFYKRFGFMKRVCLGWLAITYVPIDFDDILRSYVDHLPSLTEISSNLQPHTP
jgi:hypothetical protein